MSSLCKTTELSSLRSQRMRQYVLAHLVYRIYRYFTWIVSFCRADNPEQGIHILLPPQRQRIPTCRKETGVMDKFRPVSCLHAG